MFGGACAGLAGGYLSLVYTPQWLENMTAGRGWIALALVVFASWLPWRLAIGAYLFGTVSILGFIAQALGMRIPSQFLSALALSRDHRRLVLISGNRALMRANTPACSASPSCRTDRACSKLSRPAAGTEQQATTAAGMGH